MHTICHKKLLMLRPDEIFSDKFPPRQSFDEYELSSLSQSIAASGIIEPITVRHSGDGSYIVISGHRRLKAARLAGLRRIPCILHRTDCATAALFAVSENTQRSPLHFFEEAAAIDRVIREFAYSKAEVAARLGVALPTLTSKLKLLKLSEKLRHRIISAGLPESTARALLRLPENLRDTALDKIISGSLGEAQTQELIDNMLYPEDTWLGEVSVDFSAETREKAPPVRKSAIGDLKLFDNSLLKLVDTLESSGIDATCIKTETQEHIEYNIQIEKLAEKYKQIC